MARGCIGRYERGVGRNKSEEIKRQEILEKSRKKQGEAREKEVVVECTRRIGGGGGKGLGLELGLVQREYEREGK